MAERRMFAKTIIDSDAFLEMPITAQLLYFHLSMRADDDGFVNKPKSIMRMTGCKDYDLRMLFAKKFLIPFESGVVVIKHWRIHNYIRKDTYTETKYKEEKASLEMDENNAYRLIDTHSSQICNGCVTGASTQVRFGKDSTVQDNYIGDVPPADTPPAPKKRSTFSPPTLDDVKAYCAQRGNRVDPERWYDHYTSNGWMVGRAKMKDWKAAVRTWERNGYGSGKSRTEVSPAEDDLADIF